MAIARAKGRYVGEGSAWPTCVDVAELLHGCVRVVREQDGWSRPWRFADEQVKTMGSCLAWHPGLYRQMARATAGVCLEFDTDSTEVALEVRVDGEPSGTRAVLDRVRGDVDLPFDGVSADVGARHLACRMPDDSGVVAFELDDPDQAPLPGLVMLPGFGETRRVRIWLPALRGCVVRRLWCNGSFVNPVDARPTLLVLGDSVAQGFVTEDPALAWPSLLACRLGLDLLNQGVGGQVFQSGTLLGLRGFARPALVVVAFGENYRFEPCRPRPVARDVRSYLMEVARLWSDVPTYVCTPTWHDETVSPSHSMSCWARVPSMIAANVAVHDEMVLVDGMRLTDHDQALRFDVDGHPNAAGAAQMARRLQVSMLAAERGGQDVRAWAQELLTAAPRSAFVLAQALRQGLGELLFAHEGCVMLAVGERCLVYATDASLCVDVVAMLARGATLVALGPRPDDAAMAALGYVFEEGRHVAVYRRKVAIKMPVGKEVRPLGAEHLDAVRACAAGEGLTDEQLRAELDRGAFLGGFEGDELTGIVGETTEGAFARPEVFEAHRGSCWGQALESAKINQLLERGQIPWCLVSPEDEDMLALQRGLGLAVRPADELSLFCLRA